MEGLWAVLETMRKRGRRVFTIANVAKVCESDGILRPSTIYNAGGADYRALIQAYANDIGASTSYSPAKAGSPIDEAINSIKDLEIRTKLRALIAENRNQRAEIDRMKEAMKYYRPFAKGGELFDVEPTAEVRDGRERFAAPRRQHVDVVPIEKFISSDWLDDNNWIVDEHGAIRTRDGVRLTPIGLVTALKQAIKALACDQGAFSLNQEPKR